MWSQMSKGLGKAMMVGKVQDMKVTAKAPLSHTISLQMNAAANKSRAEADDRLGMRAGDAGRIDCTQNHGQILLEVGMALRDAGVQRGIEARAGVNECAEPHGVASLPQACPSLLIESRGLPGMTWDTSWCSTSGTWYVCVHVCACA